MTYASAGVSIDAGNELVQRIKRTVASTARPGASALIGGFGGVLDLSAAGYPGGPRVVLAIDGVGTKLKLAFATGRHDTVGVDLVAMNVNDLVVQGAEPLAFVDYFATGALEVGVAAAFVKGVARGCREARCALVGGETAEMPALYAAGEYDAAGCAMGALPAGRKVLPDTAIMRAGDVLLGLAASGVHSNGFSLVHRILAASGVSPASPAPWDASVSAGEALLVPTRIYVAACLALAERGLAKGMAHITGGGLVENIPRMLPDGLAADVDASKWPVPPVLKWLKSAGNVTAMEFARTWNTGVGMVIVVGAEHVAEAMKTLEDAGEKVRIIGSLVPREGEGCVLRNIEVWDYPTRTL
jgi:homoserine kinase